MMILPVRKQTVTPLQRARKQYEPSFPVLSLKRFRYFPGKNAATAAEGPILLPHSAQEALAERVRNRSRTSHLPQLISRSTGNISPFRCLLLHLQQQPMGGVQNPLYYRLNKVRFSDRFQRFCVFRICFFPFRRQSVDTLSDMFEPPIMIVS